MGMTATIINALAIKEKIKEKIHNNCHVVSTIKKIIVIESKNLFNS